MESSYNSILQLYQGYETITFNRPEVDTQLVYTLYAKWTAPASGPKPSIASTNALVSLSDGSLTEEVELEATAYSGEKFWLAACLLLDGNLGSTFQLRPLNVFFTKRPEKEVGKSDIDDYSEYLHISSFWIFALRPSAWSLKVRLNCPTTYTYSLRAQVEWSVCQRPTHSSAASSQFWPDPGQLSNVLHEEVQDPLVLIRRAGVGPNVFLQQHPTAPGHPGGRLQQLLNCVPWGDLQHVWWHWHDERLRNR